MSKKLRFYTDEHVPSSVVKGLEIRGVEVLTTKDSGMLGESDENQIAFAKKEKRVIFTQDEDFYGCMLKALNTVVSFMPTNVLQ